MPPTWRMSVPCSASWCRWRDRPGPAGGPTGYSSSGVATNGQVSGSQSVAKRRRRRSAGAQPGSTDRRRGRVGRCAGAHSSRLDGPRTECPRGPPGARPGVCRSRAAVVARRGRGSVAFAPRLRPAGGDGRPSKAVQDPRSGLRASSAGNAPGRDAAARPAAEIRSDRRRAGSAAAPPSTRWLTGVTNAVIAATGGDGRNPAAMCCGSTSATESRRFLVSNRVLRRQIGLAVRLRHRIDRPASRLSMNPAESVVDVLMEHTRV